MRVHVAHTTVRQHHKYCPVTQRWVAPECWCELLGHQRKNTIIEEVRRG